MKKIYEVAGTLHRGFVGQISYTICLDQEYTKMDLAFSFDNQRFVIDEITEEIKQEIIEDCHGEYGVETKTEDEIIHAILSETKTEIHTIAYMNDSFIGGVHKQLTERHMIYSPEYTSEGCVPVASIQGVIKLTLVVFNVIKNNTHYTVSLSVE